MNPFNLFGGQRHQTPPWAVEILKQQRVVIAKLETIMATIDDVLKDVTDESGRLDSLSALIAGLKQQLADALAGTTLPPEVQTKIDQVFAQAEANKAKIDTALNTGVPPASPA
jgi:hypothetical protein